MTHRMILLTLLVPFAVLILLQSGRAHAVPAEPGPSRVTQPDGSVVHVVQQGDEWKNWVETIDGYTIARGTDGFWYYVTGYEGSLPIPSRVKAHEKVPHGIEPHIRPR